MGRRESRSRNRGAVGYNRNRGVEFLLKNRNKSGVIETDSGLQYLVIEKGEGRKPDKDSIIIIHQRCQLVDGTLIEDTYRENKPSEVRLNELIEGYCEGILLMNKGARFKFFIPSELSSF